MNRSVFRALMSLCSTCILFPSLFISVALGQTIAGIQPLGSYANGGVDQVSLANLGVHIDIPLFQHKGRGSGLGINVHLVYDSSYTVGINPLIEMGWRVVPSTNTPGNIVVHQDQKNFVPEPCNPGITHCNAGYTQYTYSFAFVDSTGYAHPFDGAADSVQCQGISPLGCTDVNLIGGGYAYDGSGYLLTVNPTTPSPRPNLVTVTAPSGEVYSWTVSGATTLTDTNGNASTAVTGTTYWVNWSETLTDDANVSATITGGAYNSSNSTLWTSRAPLQVQYLDTAGVTQTVTVNYSLHNVTQSCPGSIYSATVGLADSVTYPDGTYYQFTYAANGQLASMRLPTGGTITYSVGDLCVTASPGGYVGLPAIVSRSTPDGPTVYSQTATPLAPYSLYPATSTTTVSQPDGSSEQIQFVYTLAYEGDATGDVNYNYETAHTWFSPSGSVLKSTMRCYNGATGDCTTTPITRPITQIATTTTTDGLVSKTVEYMNTAGFDTEVDEYDFGASSPARKTITTYASLGNNIANRPSSIQILDASGTVVSSTSYNYDEYTLGSTSGLPGHNTISGSRGNQTSQHRWLNTTGGTVDTHSQYDDAGQITGIQDPRLTWTHYGYDPATDSCRISVLPTTPSSGVAQSSSATCEPNTGLSATTTDANNVTTYYSYDAMLRPLGTVTKQAGVTVASTSRSYSGASLPETITTTVTATPNVDQISTEVMDGLGRTVTTIAANGAKVDTTYNSMGYVQSSSNPYITTGDSTYGITSYLYDGLGRKTYQCQPDNGGSTPTMCVPGNSYQSWTYSGNTVTARDEAGNQTKTATDALGRLTAVLEPNGASTTPSMETDYSYDVLGNLLSVTQWGGAYGSSGAQSRSFTYDSLSRLITSNHPETGLVCYGTIPSSPPGQTPTLANCTPNYDPNGNLLTKTDARGIATSYTYDILNRMLTKTYTGNGTVAATTILANTAPASYAYDTATVPNAIGRFVTEYTGTISAPITQTSVLAYDAMGRVTSEAMLAPNAVSTVSAGYDLAGDQTSLTYPDGRTIQNGIDAAGRINSIVYSTWNGISVNQNYFSESSGYDAANHLTSATFSNGAITYSAGYDHRERVNNLTYGSTSVTAWSKQFSWAVNGNLQTQADPLTGIQRQFGYDTLNRLMSGEDMLSGLPVSGGLNQTYGYDAFGNILQNGSFNSTYPAKNQMLGYSYDGAGNLNSNGVSSMAWDAESRLYNIAGATYVYDSEGRRVEKQIPAATDTVYFGGQPIARYSASQWTDLIYGPTGLFAEVPGTQTGAAVYRATDNLGTNVGGLLANGTFVSPLEHTPYGQLLTGSNSDPYLFTGKERDTEPGSGNDYFIARYYASSAGRFLSPDDGSDQNTGNPQSWNLYSYVRNNPLNSVDPDGHGCQTTTTTTTFAGKSTTTKEVDHSTCPSIAFADKVVHVAASALQTVSDFSQHFVHIMNTPGGAKCMYSVILSGGLAGAGTGGEVGLVGLAGGGVGVLVTEPTGLIVGGIGGSIVGGLGGMMVCPGATGGGAGSGSGSGSGNGNGSGGKKWKWGSHKTSQKAARQMAQRGWTDAQIDEAVQNGQQHPAPNNVNPANGATRYVNPSTGRSVVLDNVTGEVLHVGGDGFLY